VANSAGASIAINAYDEWGVPNAGNQGRFQYTGQAWLPELGMYHYKARIYSPTLGRFLHRSRRLRGSGQPLRLCGQ
jgi:RHS repeat-associated protein